MCWSPTGEMIEQRVSKPCNSKACRHFFLGKGCKRGAACKFEHILHDLINDANPRSHVLPGGLTKGETVRALVDVAARGVKAGDQGLVVRVCLQHSSAFVSLVCPQVSRLPVRKLWSIATGRSGEQLELLCRIPSQKCRPRVCRLWLWQGERQYEGENPDLSH